jgi:ubiquinone/menaquinone biosynthesis C-methylase UbiE
MSVTQMVSDHYGFGTVRQTVLGALEAPGLRHDALRPDDLAPFDEFHTRGRRATEELVAAMELRPSMHVLDVGSGVGGPARHVADSIGCRVTGLDLVDEYVDLAGALASACGLSDRLTFLQGDATRMPFAGETFDAAYTQHACMNISDKSAVYAEVRRLLRPDAGVFGIYDVMQGPGGTPFFPVPWAKSPRTSFLATPREVRDSLDAAGFDVESVEDRTEECVAWFEEVRAHAASTERPLGIHLLLGPRFPEIAANLMRNLVERRIAAVQVIARPRR